MTKYVPEIKFAGSWYAVQPDGEMCKFRTIRAICTFEEATNRLQKFQGMETRIRETFLIGGY